MRAHAIGGDEPSVVMAKTNEIVDRFTTSDTFVSAVFGILDLERSTITYCTAGHPAPALVGPRGVRRLEVSGPVLGAFLDLDFDTVVTPIEHGESLVMFTDGLTEARSASGVFYGEERLIAFLEALAGADPRDIADLLQTEIREFSGGRLRDDTAVLVLKPV